MLQVISYIIYLSLSSFITIYVGWKCYHNGYHYVQYLLKDVAISKAVNKLLLLGYYLVNIGYIALSIHNWESIIDWAQLLSQVGSHIGIIVSILCVLHFINMLTLFALSKKKIFFNH